MSRSLDDIRSDREGTVTVSNLVEVLEMKLRLCGRYGVFEYEASQEGLHACSDTFRDMAREEREHIDRLLTLLAERPDRQREHDRLPEGGLERRA